MQQHKWESGELINIGENGFHQNHVVVENTNGWVVLIWIFQQDKGRPLPKFGEWDVNNPASAEGFTVIFNKARDDKKTNAAQVTPRKQDGSIRRNTPKYNNDYHVDQYPSYPQKEKVISKTLIIGWWWWCVRVMFFCQIFVLPNSHL